MITRFQKVGAALTMAVLMTAFSSFANQEDRVSVTNLHVKNGQNGIPYIAGDARNNTNITLKHVAIKFNLYQGSDVVANTIDTIENLGPGETYKIQAPANPFQYKFDSYKVTSINIIE
ncbi:FxLYD domain-containing protein [Xenorhabdus sp. Sc-CR9]|uniref:FxLYD domain-containing protein n=1 Tax=Xenorhabdus sp. Sc-CR9 TaxID=2584468 RepID=UPI001F2A2BC1|nr:FxLYD domain-containing protein [Xenorhabdus sp. Sc-CR9]